MKTLVTIKECPVFAVDEDGTVWDTLNDVEVEPIIVTSHNKQYKVVKLTAYSIVCTYYVHLLVYKYFVSKNENINIDDIRVGFCDKNTLNCRAENLYLISADKRAYKTGNFAKKEKKAEIKHRADACQMFDGVELHNFASKVEAFEYVQNHLLGEKSSVNYTSVVKAINENRYSFGCVWKNADSSIDLYDLYAKKVKKAEIQAFSIFDVNNPIDFANFDEAAKYLFGVEKADEDMLMKFYQGISCGYTVQGHLLRYKNKPVNYDILARAKHARNHLNIIMPVGQDIHFYVCEHKDFSKDVYEFNSYSELYESVKNILAEKGVDINNSNTRPSLFLQNAVRATNKNSRYYGYYWIRGTSLDSALMTLRAKIFEYKKLKNKGGVNMNEEKTQLVFPDGDASKAESLLEQQGYEVDLIDGTRLSVNTEDVSAVVFLCEENNISVDLV